MTLIVIHGLNMNAVNALIWIGAVLGKMTIFSAIGAGILWLIVFAVGAIE